MTRYRKRPVAVEAVRYTGPESLVDVRLLGARLRGDPTDDGSIELWNEEEGCWIRCPVDHWVIRGVAGECYPCSPDVFAATYEPLP